MTANLKRIQGENNSKIAEQCFCLIEPRGIDVAVAI